MFFKFFSSLLLSKYELLLLPILEKMLSLLFLMIFDRIVFILETTSLKWVLKNTIVFVVIRVGILNTVSAVVEVNFFIVFDVIHIRTVLRVLVAFRVIVFVFTIMSSVFLNTVIKLK